MWLKLSIILLFLMTGCAPVTPYRSPFEDKTDRYQENFKTFIQMWNDNPARMNEFMLYNII